MNSIEALIDDGGEITLGAVGNIECAATAADHHNTLAMLVRRDGETLTPCSSGWTEPSPSSTRQARRPTRSTRPATDHAAVKMGRLDAHYRPITGGLLNVRMRRPRPVAADTLRPLA